MAWDKVRPEQPSTTTSEMQRVAWGNENSHTRAGNWLWSFRPCLVARQHGWGLAQAFGILIKYRGALPLSRFVRQGGVLDFLFQESNDRLPSAPACVRSTATRSPRYPQLH